MLSLRSKTTFCALFVFRLQLLINNQVFQHGGDEISDVILVFGTPLSIPAIFAFLWAPVRYWISTRNFIVCTKAPNLTTLLPLLRIWCKPKPNSAHCNEYRPSFLKFVEASVLKAISHDIWMSNTRKMIQTAAHDGIFPSGTALWPIWAKVELRFADPSFYVVWRVALLKNFWTNRLLLLTVWPNHWSEFKVKIDTNWDSRVAYPPFSKSVLQHCSRPFNRDIAIFKQYPV